MLAIQATCGCRAGPAPRASVRQQSRAAAAAPGPSAAGARPARMFAGLRLREHKGRSLGFAIRAEEQKKENASAAADTAEELSVPSMPPSKEGAAAGGGGDDDMSGMTGDELAQKLQEMKAQQAAANEKPGLVEGVLEEIKEIQWPGAGEVTKTTLVVCGAILGSSFALLGVNLLFSNLAEFIF